MIQLNLNRIESGDLDMGKLQKWQTENYRDYPTEALFSRLSSLEIQISAQDFETLGKGLEDPEQMLEKLVKEEEPLAQDQVFLLIFELWRRIFPEKRTLSIFCDELDYQITQHDLGHSSEIQDSLAYLQQILDEQVDNGLKPKEAFQLTQVYCANDLESFLYDYTLSLVDQSDLGYASELLEGFSPYLPDSIWFAYLVARVKILDDLEEGYEKLEKVIKKITKDTGGSLVEEILYYLANTGNHYLFTLLAKKTLLYLEFETQLLEFIEICYLHFDYLELKEPSLTLAEMFYNRPKKDPKNPISQADPYMSQLRSLLSQKLHM